MTRYGREKPPPGAQLERGHPLAQGLAFLCALREGGGTSARDTIRGASGTLGSGVTWTQSPFGAAAQGDGTANGAITWSFAATAQTAAVTLECWAYLGSASLAGALLGLGNAGGDGYALGVGATSLATTGNNLIGTYIGVTNHATGVAIGTGWHHVAMVIDSAGHPTFYIDGVRQSYTSSSTPLVPTVATYVLGVTTSGPRYVAGAVAKASIYTRALGDGEIQRLVVEPYALFRSAPPPWARRVRRSVARSSAVIVV